MNGSNMDGTDTPKKPDPDSKPSSRRPTRRCIYIIVAVLILCIIICIVLAVQLRPKSKDDCPKGIHCDWRSMPHSEFLKDERCDSLCTTRPCIRSAQYILSRIDSSKDPCEDFYEFSCGTSEQETVTFSEQSTGIFASQEMENEVLLNLKEIIDSADENPNKTSFALRLTKNLYNDCMETDNHPEVLTKQIWKRLFAENGMVPWPLINGNARNDQKHLVKIMASTLFFGANPFFKLKRVGTVQTNNKGFLVFHFVKSDNIEKLQSIHKDQDDDDEESIGNRYRFAMGQILTELGVSSSELKEIIPNITHVENHFLEMATKAIEANEKVYENNRHLSYEFHNHSCQDLDHNMGNIKWCELVKHIRKEYGYASDTPVRIELPSLADYFVAVNTVLGHYLDRDIINYIGVKFMFQFLKYMPSPLRELYHSEEDLFPEKSTSLPLTARWQQCVEIVSEFMWLPLEKEYLKEKLDEKARDQVRHMVKKIKEIYLSLLDKMTWLKTALKGKDPKKLVRDTNLVIGRADELMNTDEEEIDRIYSLGFESAGKGVKNTLLLDVLQMKAFYRNLPLFPNVDDYITASSMFFKDEDGFNRDSIEVSYDALAFPMFLPGRPMYSEYANLGTTVSAYIISMLFLHMNPENSTIAALLTAMNCLSEQGHLYKTRTMIPKGNTNEETKKLTTLMIYTLGTHASFQAYADYLKQNGEDKGLPGLPFTSEQLYFISAAQAHCEKLTEEGYSDMIREHIYPARYRVNVPFAHLKEFSEAFRCPADSSMNLKRRCCLLGDGKLSHDCK